MPKLKPRRAKKKRKAAQEVVPKPLPDKAMEPDEFTAALEQLGLTVASQRTAKLLGTNVRRNQRLASGDSEIPNSVARLIRMFLKFGTDETKVSVRCEDGSLVEAIEIDAGIWDVAYPWDIERLYGNPKEIADVVRERFRKKMAALNEQDES